MQRNKFKNERSATRILSFTAIITLIFILTSCNKKQMISYDFKYNKWAKDDTINFQFTVNDTIKNHQLLFFFRNNLDYNYRNLFLIIDLDYNYKKIQSDTVEYEIADKYGRWLGRGLGNIKDNYLIFSENTIFQKKGIYNINVRHGMRQDSLIGVNKLGFQIK